MTPDLFRLVNVDGGDKWTTRPDYEPAPPVEMNPWYDTTASEQCDDDGCSVYLIDDGTHYKIGLSTTPTRRLSSLASASPRHMSIVALRAGGKDLEQFLHATLRGYRIRREWFERRPEVFDAFMSLQLPEHDEEFELAG